MPDGPGEQGRNTRHRNLVLRGFHPDPSICRVEEDFYMATSSFAYWPGVPVFHSRSLTDRSLVGHCLTRDSQVRLEGRRSSRGILAPTLRHHEGRFYMIITDVDGIGSFIVHSPSTGGPQSDPAVIDQNGIDLSLFWDEDGACWYCGKGSSEGKRGIIAFVLDPLTDEILSDKYVVSKDCDGRCAEDPHIHKRDGWYYLLIVEGGTQYSHRTVIQRSRDLISGYEPRPHNPLLSHQRENWRVVQAVRHGDLVQDQYRNWWAVRLGIRVFGDYLLHDLGRETFLVPVVWRDGQPVMGRDGRVELMMDSKTERMMDGSPGTGRDEMCAVESEGDRTGTAKAEGTKAEETKAEETKSEETELEEIVREQWELDFRVDRMLEGLWYICNPHLHCYETGGERLVLRGNDTGLDNTTGSLARILREQRGFVIDVRSCVGLKDCGQGRFEMIVYHSGYNHYNMVVVEDETGCRFTLYKCIHDLGAVIGETRLDRGRGKLWLGIQADREGYYFDHSLNSRDRTELGRGAIAGLCTEVMMEWSYTGTMVRLFAEHGQGVFKEGFLIISE